MTRARDFAEVNGSGKITLDISKSTLSNLGIDKIGLDHMDRKILKTIVDKFKGGPVGLKSLSVALGEDSVTIEDVYEPFLIKKGFIRAETISYEDFVNNNGWVNSKTNGKMRLEGKDYIVKDGDVLNFRFNT